MLPVLFYIGEALEVPEKGDAPDIVQLRHPQSGQGSLFLFSNGDGMLQEVLTFSENKRYSSYFICCNHDLKIRYTRI